MRPTVALDRDGLLVPTYEHITKWRSQRPDAVSYHPFDREAHPSYDLTEVWGADADREAEIWFNASDFMTTPPIEGAVELVRNLESEVDFVVITSGYEERRPPIRSWVERFFPQVKDVLFVDPSQSNGTDPFNKAEACKWIGADAILEDRYDYARECADAGVRAIVVDRYLWGRGDDHPLITHVSDLIIAETVLRSLLL